MADGGVGGFSYGTVLRLAGVAAENWYAIDGACARQGFDPLDLTLRRFCALVYSWLMEHIDPDDLERVREELFAPVTWNLRDPDAVSQDVIDEEMALFANFSRQNSSLGGG